jgi:hypothetical protein
METTEIAKDNRDEMLRIVQENLDAVQALKQKKINTPY